MQEPTESDKTGPWLADNQSRDLYLVRSVGGVMGLRHSHLCKFQKQKKKKDIESQL